jgi:biopolymer transport protein ExbB/TolQ
VGRPDANKWGNDVIWLADFNVNSLASLLGDACYGFLALNFLWGLFCVIMLWRRIGTLRFRSEAAQTEFLDRLDEKLEADDFQGTAEICQEEEYGLAQLAATAISHRRLGIEQVRQILTEMVQSDIVADLESRLSWVATVIKAGPLLGLFGTVLGMMAAFGRIGTGEKVQPSQIAHEISIALICTAMGLATAIPFSFLLASLNIRVRMLQESLGSGLARFLDSFESAAARTAGQEDEHVADETGNVVRS